MLAQYPLSTVEQQSEPTVHAAPSTALPVADVAELLHLARAVLLKSPQDLAAIGEAVPSLTANWIEAFAAERARAEAEARFWSTAIAYLMATSAGTVANDG
jgi:hypothetical protein